VTAGGDGGVVRPGDGRVHRPHRLAVAPARARRRSVGSGSAGSASPDREAVEADDDDVIPGTDRSRLRRRAQRQRQEEEQQGGEPEADAMCHSESLFLDRRGGTVLETVGNRQELRTASAGCLAETASRPPVYGVAVPARALDIQRVCDLASA
jgi:hypothetical protein